MTNSTLIADYSDMVRQGSSLSRLSFPEIVAAEKAIPKGRLATEVAG
jgi:hypothetical protein